MKKRIRKDNSGSAICRKLASEAKDQRNCDVNRRKKLKIGETKR
ncbi:hypothetical protein ACFO4N_09070 [Camelliibacillus cellulosilyticus]|uniref:Uncharacterized protein n=1 Tax=Camelliibacillus cellulosilyticus TaxID=2174486 RepID=A0ABV9GL52_9BACL